MKVENHPADAVFLRPKTDSITGTTNNTKVGEDFASLMGESVAAKKDSTQGTGAMDLLSGNRQEYNATSFLSQSSLAQLQLTRLQLNSQVQLTPKETSEKIEEALGLLEEYAVALGDPANSLKDLAPLAEELSLSADSLNSLSLGLANGDPLKDIASETATISKVEALKFKRGDFV
ncbi:MAG: hypothetical protein LBE38_01735 [Deltaproteobacteria bacterium]|jgi:hypothetical protein|nr:hypothetical protein [Deltaproteobacteria bacterium]